MSPAFALAASLVLLLGCAATPMSGTRETTPGKDAKAPVREAEPPGFRARVWIGPGQGAPDWSGRDIAVLDTTARGQALCDELAKEEVTRLSRARLAARLDRPCARGALPRLPETQTPAILVHTRELTSTELLLRDPVGKHEPTLSGKVQVTDFSLFASEAECERMRTELTDKIVESRADTGFRAREWTADQLRLEQTVAKRICAAADMREGLCDAMEDSEEERRLCFIHATRERRDCDSRQATVSLLESRVAADDVTRDSSDRTEPLPECRKSYPAQ